MLPHVILALGSWWQGRFEIQGHLLLLNKLEASLGHVRSCLKTMSGVKERGKERKEWREEGKGEKRMKKEGKK